MAKLLIILGLAVILLLLVRRGWLQSDLSLPWSAALVVLGFLSLNDSFVDWLAAQVGVVYQPIAVLLVVFFLFFGIITSLAIALSRIRLRQLQIVRYLAAMQLERVGSEASDELVGSSSPRVSPKVPENG